MIYYCPQCRKEVEIKDRETQVTLSGRVAHKSNCPTCSEPVVEFIPGEKQEVTQEMKDKAEVDKKALHVKT